MKKLKDLNLAVINDKNALTINGGHSCDGTITSSPYADHEVYFELGDWDDEGCC